MNILLNSLIETQIYAQWSMHIKNAIFWYRVNITITALDNIAISESLSEI